MSDEQKKQDDLKAQMAKEIADMHAPPGTYTKGSHHYPSPGGGSLYNSVPPLGHTATFRKLRD